MHLTTENIIKGRRTSPDTGVGSFGSEATSGSGGDTSEDGIGVFRRRGAGKCLGLDEDALLSGGDGTLASEELPIDGMGGTAKVDFSGMVSEGGTCVCTECRVVILTSISAGAIVGFAVSGALSMSL